MPAMVLSNVLLPVPFLPMIEALSPSSSPKVTPVKSGSSRPSFERLLTERRFMQKSVSDYKKKSSSVGVCVLPFDIMYIIVNNIPCCYKKRSLIIMKSRTAIVSLLGAAVVLLASCATSVPVTVTRPAELDLHGAKTVSVLPFQISDDKDLQHTNSSFVNVLLALDYLLRDDDKNEVECANYLSTQLTSKLSESTYLTLVDADVVKTALTKGKKAPVDVYLTGKISNFKYGVD